MDRINSQANFSTMLIMLSEQLGNPAEYQVDRYVSPIVKWMTNEWKRIRQQIADNIFDIAREEFPFTERIINEEIWFPEGKQNRVKQMIDALIGGMGKELAGKVADAKRQARIDEKLPGLTNWKDTRPMVVKLSREGLEEVIAGLDYQRGFVDDFKKTTQKRIGALVRARYGGFTQLRQKVNRELRIDRDKTMGMFENEVQGFGQRVIDGKLSADDFVTNMESSIGKYYERLYREGKGVTKLEDWELELLKKQVQSQRQYLDNFANLIKTKQASGQELTSWVTARANLYAQRGSAMFEAGQVNQWPDDVLLDWVLQPAEHCTTCPVFAMNSPYDKNTLPGYPGEGFHLTQCGTNCKCKIEVSDLYVWKAEIIA